MKLTNLSVPSPARGRATDNLRDNTEVAKWLDLLPHRLQRRGIPVLQLDHVTTDREARGRFAIGAQHKLAGVDVVYSLKVKEPFGRGMEGQIQVRVENVGPGHVRSHTVDGWIADVRLLSDDEGAVTISLEPPAEPESFRPTFLMERLSEPIEAEPGIGKADLRRAVRGKNDA